jgi:hypothetical protein
MKVLKHKQAAPACVTRNVPFRTGRSEDGERYRLFLIENHPQVSPELHLGCGAQRVDFMGEQGCAAESVDLGQDIFVERDDY